MARSKDIELNFYIHPLDSLKERKKKYKEEYIKDKELPRAESDAQTFDYYYNPEPSDPADLVKYTMAYASRYLAANGNPTPEKPYCLDYGYKSIIPQWTAFMVFGETCNFDHKSIKTTCSKVNKEIGFFSRYSSSSFYETEFKQHIKPYMLVKSRTVALYEGISGSLSVEEQQEIEKKRLFYERYPQYKQAQKKEDTHKKGEAEERNEIAESRKQAAAQQENNKQEEKIINNSESLCHMFAYKKYAPSVKITDIEQYLDNGADINYQDLNGNTPLINALDNRYEYAAEFLIKKGANPFLANYRGLTPSMLVSKNSSVYELIQDKETLPELKKKESVSWHKTHKLHTEFLDEVCTISPQIRKIKEFLAQGVNINYQDKDGYTALMLAIDHQNDHIAEYLLNQGANPCIQNMAGEKAIDLVSSSSPMFGLLTEKESTSLLNELSSKEKYNTLLHKAVTNPETRIKTIKEYLRLGAAINYQDLNGDTALIIAATAQHIQIADHLIKLGANPLLKNKKGKLASDLISPQSPLFEYLKNLEKTAQLKKLPANERFSTLLLEHTSIPEPKIQKIDEFLSLGADINYQNANGYTALMIVAETQNERITEYLLLCGANPLLQNKTGKTASNLVPYNSDLYQIIKGYELLFATRNGNLLTIKALLNDDNSLINFRDHRGFTALLIAVEQNMETIVEYLLTQNADLTITCNGGQDIFALVTNENIRTLLLQKQSFSISEQPDTVTDEVDRTFKPFGFFSPSSEVFNSPKEEKIIISSHQVKMQ